VNCVHLCSSGLYIDCIVNRALTTHCLLWLVYGLFRLLGNRGVSRQNRGNHHPKAVTRNLFARVFISHPFRPIPLVFFAPFLPFSLSYPAARWPFKSN